MEFILAVVLIAATCMTSLENGALRNENQALKLENQKQEILYKTRHTKDRDIKPEKKNIEDFENSVYSS